MKLLGVTFSGDGSVKDHLVAKASTSGRLVGMLRRQSKFLSEEARYRVYVATIRPVMEYGCPVFVNSPPGHLTALDKIQERAARLFPSLACKLDPLGLRREVSGLCQLYRIADGTAPLAVRRSIQPTFAFQSTRRVTRNNETLTLRAMDEPKSRTTAHQRSYLPHFTRSWNRLSDEETFAPTLKKFKRRIATCLRSRWQR